MRTWGSSRGTTTAKAWWTAIVTDCVIILSSSSCPKEIAYSFVLLFSKLLLPLCLYKKKEDNIKTYVEETGYVNVYYIHQCRACSWEHVIKTLEFHKRLFVIVPSELSLTSEKGCAVWSCCVSLFFLNNVVACRVWRKLRQISWWSKPGPLHWEADVWILHSFNVQLLNFEITVLCLRFDTGKSAGAWSWPLVFI